MFLLNRKICRTFLFNEHMTWAKAINVLKGFYYYHFSHNPCIGSRPLRLVIDTGNTCTLKCPLCPTGLGRTDRQKSFLKLEDFKKIIDETKEYLFEVDLYNWGEPFLNKDIFCMIEYAKKANIKVNVTSNFNALSQDQLDSIASSGIDELTVSVDGADSETYEKYRRGGNFNQVMASLKSLVKKRTAKGSVKTKIIWQFLVMRHNQHQIALAKSMARGLGVDKIIFRPVRCDMGDEIFMTDREKIESARAWLPIEEKYSRYKYETKIKKSRPRKCLFLETTMVINPDGAASPCCGVYASKWDFGNVLQEGVFHVWNNEKYQKARKAVRERNSSAKDLICSYCVKNGFLEY